MSRGTLARATRALRETTQRDPLEAVQVDARLRAVLNELSPVRERRPARWLAAAAVLLVTGLFGGWAGATGRIGRAFEAAAAWVSPAPRQTAPRPARRVRPTAPEAPLPSRAPPAPEAEVSPAPEAEVASAPAAEVAPGPAAPAQKSLAPMQPRRPAVRSARGQAPPSMHASAAASPPSAALATAPAPSDVPPPPALLSPAPAPAPAPAASENALYDDGHRAQFVTRDYAQAVRAWDLYLERHPAGRLAPEARYNRAIALFRLGRRAAAADALKPFAQGDYGSYRRAEAQALSKALGNGID